MLTFIYTTAFFLVPVTTIFCSLWFLFFKTNSYTHKIKGLPTDKAASNYKIVVPDGLNFFYTFFFNFFFFFFFLFCFKNYSYILCYTHLLINNFTIYSYYLILLFNLLVLYMLYCRHRWKPLASSDYFFAITNVNIILPFIFFSNNVFFFFLILEVSSALLLYMFVISNIFSKNNSKKDKKMSLRNLLTTIFFQYWSTFFSSVLLIFSLIFFFFYYGTSEWSIITVLNELKSNFYVNSYGLYIIFIIFFFSFFIKLGITPAHLFKIEVYKGVPYVTIFLYSTYYFLIFLLYMTVILNLYFNIAYNFWWIIIPLFLIIGIVFILGLLFDTNYIKSFFAYSTILNVVNFLCIALSLYT